MSMTTRRPAPPPESLGKRFMRSLRFYGMIFFFIALWAGSSLFIAPIVQWTIDRVGGAMIQAATLKQDSNFLDMKLSIPCNSFETLPPGCDGLAIEGGINYGPSSILYFWGRLPELDGQSQKDRSTVGTPTATTDGVFYTLQRAFGRLPSSEESVHLAREQMNTYGAYTERQLAPGVDVIEAAEGSSTRLGNFYAVYTRDDGLKVAAACFGETCKVPQVPWRDRFAYGITINKRHAAQLPEIDAKVRERLNGYRVE